MALGVARVARVVVVVVVVVADDDDDEEESWSGRAGLDRFECLSRLEEAAAAGMRSMLGRTDEERIGKGDLNF